MRTVAACSCAGRSRDTPSLLVESTELRSKARSAQGRGRGDRQAHSSSSARVSLVFPLSGLLQFESLVIHKIF